MGEKQDVQGILVHLRNMQETLKGAESRVADFILAQPQEIIHLPISELAERSGSSEATVFRLCRRLGCAGYQALKIALAQELVSPLETIHEEVSEEDDPGSVAQKVFYRHTQSLNETLKVLSRESLAQATAALAAARRVEFYGSGGSGAVALDAMHKFMRTGLLCAAYTDSHLQVMGASLLEAGDVAVGISHSGSSKDVVEAIEVARAAGATTIAITDRMRSPLVKAADIALFTASQETVFRTEALASRLAQLAIVDSLFVAVSLARKEAALDSVQKIRRAIARKRF